MHRIAIDFSRTTDTPASLIDPAAMFSGRAVDQLVRCSRVCSDAAGGVDVSLSADEPERMRLMIATAEVCRAAAHVLILGVSQHRALCEACADLCDACAQSCDAEADMFKCARVCRDAAEACRRVLAH